MTEEEANNFRKIGEHARECGIIYKWGRRDDRKTVRKEKDPNRKNNPNHRWAVIEGRRRKKLRLSYEKWVREKKNGEGKGPHRDVENESEGNEANI